MQKKTFINWVGAEIYLHVCVIAANATFKAFTLAFFFSLNYSSVSVVGIRALCFNRCGRVILTILCKNEY